MQAENAALKKLLEEKVPSNVLPLQAARLAPALMRFS